MRLGFFGCLAPSVVVVVLGAGVLLGLGCSAEEGEATALASDEPTYEPSDRPAVLQPVPVDAASPEALFRAFFVAMLDGNRHGVESVIVPHPDSSVLWDNQQPPLPVYRQMRAGFERITCRAVSVGETARLVGNTFEVTADMVTPDKPMYVLAIDGRDMETPMWLERDGDEWRIDASMLIASRIEARRAEAGG